MIHWIQYCPESHSRECCRNVFQKRGTAIKNSLRASACKGGPVLTNSDGPRESNCCAVRGDPTVRATVSMILPLLPPYTEVHLVRVNILNGKGPEWRLYPAHLLPLHRGTCKSCPRPLGRSRPPVLRLVDRRPGILREHLLHFLQRL